ncbi:hypothetical protein NIES4101_56000 [Calothrix sp. NIES-4101]|nr:hypothetical protein NIES4101_56000 [Calothrix sp. NIES-4101]
MRSLKLNFFILASVGLLFLSACANQTADSSGNSQTEKTGTIAKNQTASTAKATTNSQKNTDHSRSSKGGEVVETGKYHLELVPEKQGKATHLDFYLQTGDTHKAISNAKVTADIQSPDGKQKTIPLIYDADGKHYAATLDRITTGQYQVRINADISGEKVNGRFSVNL